MGAKSQNSSSTLTSARCCAVLLLGAVGLVVNCRLRSQLETSSTGGGSERGGVRAAAASDGHPYVVNKNSLAFRESYGFFDDLSDFDWALRREQARTHRHHIDPSAKVATEQTDVLMYYLKNYYPIFTCPHQRRVGGSGDGAKWTCDPWRLKYVARQPTRRQGANKKEGGGGMVLRGDNVVKDDGKCLIYSVGCRGNYVFEDGIVNLVGAGTCEIHVFDLTKDYTRPNDSTDKDIHFHYWGLASSYSNLGRNKKYTYMTLQETMQKLGHVNRTIDIFKIDCEHCEWFTYKDWISKDVDIRQLLIETHGIPVRHGLQPSAFFDDIEAAGFAMFSKEPNTHPAAGGKAIEWSFVKLRSEFFGKN